MRQNWDDAKAHIYKYYKTQNKSLKELRRLMENNHDFRASPRSYLNKIVRWGYKKNVRKTVRPARPVGTATATAVLTPSLHTVADRISNSDQVLLPMVSSHRDDAQSFWPATGILESPHQDTLYHTYDGYEALQTTIPNSGIGNMSYQSPHVNDPVEEPLDMNGQNRLHHAAIDGDLERVRVLLSANCSLHETDYNGNQPLHYAARGLCVGIIDLLLKNGANVNARGEEGRTPLHLALRSTKAVNRLLQEHPTISAHDDKGDSALHMALSEASNGATSFSIVQGLVRSGYDVNKSNNLGETPFHMACGVCSSTDKLAHQILALFLENKADVSLPTTDGKLPFQLFLTRMNNLWSRSDRGIYICKLFLRRGADPNTVANGRPFLHIVISGSSMFGKNSEFVKSLCETADVSKLADNGDSALHICTGFFYRPSYRDYVDSLLRRGANPDQLDSCGNTPLMMLSKANYHTECLSSMMTSLLQAGANPMLRDRSGDLPVYHAYRLRKINGCGVTRVQVLVDSYIAGDKPVEERTIYQDDHIWWLEYRRLCQEKTWCGHDSRTLVNGADYLPDDIGKELSQFLLVQAANEMLEGTSQKFSKHKGAYGLGTTEGRVYQNEIVGILRECLRMKLDINQSWYHLTLDFFD